MKGLTEFIKTKRLRINIPISTIIMILSFIVISVVTILIAPKEFSKDAMAILTNPRLLFLNSIPVALFMAILFFVTNNAVLSSSITGTVFIVSSVANFQKIILRQDPFIPNDIFIIREAFGIIKNFPPKQLIFYSSVLAAFIILIIISIIFFRTHKLKPVIRVIGIAAVIIISVFLNTFIYSSESLYNSFTVDGNIYFEVNQFESKGFVYSFIYKFNSLKIQKPEGYTKETFADIDSSAEEEIYDNNKLPHIIMVMGESFSDLSENEHLDFSNYSDPMENIKRLASSENSLYGHIIVPNFGGGTSNTEFDVLTGYPTRYLVNDGISYNYVRSNLDTIPSRLRDAGYSTLAIHPGFSWFYNRLNVYNYMGFDNFIHLTSFQGEEKYKGGYIADKYLTDSIIENFESHVSENDSPLFNFCVTIQNHGPYDEKYNEVEKMFDCDIKLTETEQILLNSYFMGIRDNDYEIGRLADYFSNCDEPVVLVFFGDHLPGFSNGMEFFDILDYNIDINGTDEQRLNLYSTPFLIWENDAAAALTNFSEKLTNLDFPENNKISANFLGVSLLELVGLDGISPFYQFANQLRRSVPVSRDDTHMLIDTTYTNQLNDTDRENLNRLIQWSYYKVFDSN